MRHTLKTAKTMMPVALSTLVLVGAAPQVAIAAQNTQSTPVSNVGGGYRDSDSSLPPVRETLTQKEAEDLPGCEAVWDTEKNEAVIRPKNGASEGVISAVLDNKKGDLKVAFSDTIAYKLVNEFQQEHGAGFPLRFDKRVYIWGAPCSFRDSLYFMKQAPISKVDFTNLHIGFATSLEALCMTTDYIVNLKGYTGLQNWDTSKITNMQQTFAWSASLSDLLDLSKWNTSNVTNMNHMFGEAANTTEILNKWPDMSMDNENKFVLNFSNKDFSKIVEMDGFSKDARGVFIANSWTLPQSNDNLFSKTNIFGDTCQHLLITDNEALLARFKDDKFYKKVKVIYKDKANEKSVELELPAVYDSRIDDMGKPDPSKAASADAMKIVKPQFDDAIKQAIKNLRDQNEALNLPENVIPVSVHELKDGESPVALFQDYYLATVKEEVTKAKTTYTADPTLEYKKVEYDTSPQDGKKQVITGQMVNGAWVPDATTEKEITKVVDGKARVGNKEVIQNNDGSTTTKTYKVNPNDGTLSDPTVETTRPWTDIASGAAVSEVLKGKMTYVADELLPYGQTQKVSDPKDGEKITTPTGKVENGKWVEGEPKVEITAAVNGVTKVGNKKVKTEDIQPGVTYEADSSLTYKQEQTTEGTKGTKTTTTIYKVDEDTGLTNTVQSTESKTTTAAKDKVIKVGNVKTETETIKCKTVYIADDTIEYNTQQDKTAGNDGSKTVTTTYKVNKTTGLTTDVESIKGKKVDPTDHVVRVGNKQVTHDGDKTITTTYDVDPNTGKLTNPQKHTSMSWSDLIPAKPVTPDTDNHESDNSGDNAGTNAATDTSASQPKHMKQTPKTGDMGSFGALLSSLGLSLMGFATLHKKKH